MTWVLVILGGGLGAALRHLTDRAVTVRLGAAFPWGTLTVNVAGCLLWGVLAGLAAGGGLPDAVRLSVGVGLCGALTTYSTFSYETLRLAERGSLGLAAANTAASVLAAVGAVFAGAALARGMWS